MPDKKTRIAPRVRRKSAFVRSEIRRNKNATIKELRDLLQCAEPAVGLMVRKTSGIPLDYWTGIAKRIATALAEES